ncbi:MAG: type I restriction enzyme HsdR N-terminal domain-containing protein [Paludibacteraceae bacterium]|nr:type I restriction enzyme HsdR N-terminal domain-containing protein [Paludibacteraceae bacterium]
MPMLNLPACDLHLRRQDASYQVFDFLRRRYVRLTPEEWVRQHFLHYMIETLGYPAERIAVEFAIKVNNCQKRCDAVVFDKFRQPQMIVEFKAPHVRLTQHTIDQVAVYNLRLNVDYFIISNGITHLAFKLDREASRFVMCGQLPDYAGLNRLTEG